MTDDSVWDVSDWEILVGEQQGAKEKIWLKDPTVAKGAQNNWLFKPVTTHGDGSVQGGEWAEKLASGLAGLLSIPAAQVEIAERDGVRGTLSRNVRVSDDWDMYNGELWLNLETTAQFQPGVRAVQKGATAGHSLDVLEEHLSRIGPPPQSTADLASWTGFGVFAGYLTLDALIANRDRHEKNWAVLRPRLSEGESVLAASYDHEASLGFNLTDEARLVFIDDPSRMERFCERGTAWRFDWGGLPVPSLVGAAVDAAMRCGGECVRTLTERVDSISSSQLEALVASIPGMSEVARTFCLRLITRNQERLRDAFRVIDD